MGEGLGIRELKGSQVKEEEKAPLPERTDQEWASVFAAMGIDPKALGSPSSEMSLEDIEFWVAKVRHHHELIEQNMAINKSKRLALTAICRARPEAQKFIDAAVACTNAGCREKARNELLAWRDGCLKEVK